MGSFNSDYIIYIREQAGSRTMFSAGELRDRLLHCIGDEQTADDITLAVEYSLLNRSDREHDFVFDRGEIDAAVVRLLEETGFPESAAEYRSGVYFEDEELTADGSEILKLLRSHLGCPEQTLVQVCADVCRTVERIGITSASPHLYLELGRYFTKHRKTEALPELPPHRDFDASELEKLPQKLSAENRRLLETGVFETEFVTAIFPCVKFHVYMEQFSKFYEVSCPVTELLVYPAASEVSSALEECRIKLQEGDGTKEMKLPCTLVIHELRRFVRDAFECSDNAALDAMSGELGEVFAGSLGRNLFKLDFD